MKLQKLKIVFYQDKAGEWRFRAMRRKVILFEASEGYKSISSIRKMLHNAVWSFKDGNFSIEREDGKQVFDLWGRP